MIHDIEQIRSLKKYIEVHKDEKATYDQLLNSWIRESGACIQDADTVDYYLALILMIERSISKRDRY